MTADEFIKCNEIILKYCEIENYNNDNENIKYYLFKKFGIKFRIMLDAVPSKDKRINYLLLVYDYYQDNTIENVFIDLICYVLNEKNQYVANNLDFTEKDIYEIPDMYPLKKIKFENIYFNCVYNPIPFLNHLYWFWKDLGVLSHAHFNTLKKDRNKNKYYLLK